ncbi:MAG TPA: hypothetical protein VJZ71_07925 [Phycisphaerae bacterium]|nr:hypothetical protein [Phycisphaerae bacterium]
MILKCLSIALLFILALFSAGCIIPVPIAVLPVRGIGSGDTIEFRDKQSEKLKCSGWAIVCRSKAWDWHGFSTDEVSCRLVHVANGKATLPEEWNLSILWLVPNEIAWGYGLAALGSNPLYTLAAVPFWVIPLPIVVPLEQVRIIPLISGYYPPSEVASFHVYRQRFALGSESNRNVCYLSPNRPVVATQYWRKLERILNSPRNPWGIEGQDWIFLEPRERELARAIIDGELRHLVPQRYDR